MQIILCTYIVPIVSLSVKRNCMYCTVFSQKRNFASYWTCRIFQQTVPIISASFHTYLITMAAKLHRFKSNYFFPRCKKKKQFCSWIRKENKYWNENSFSLVCTGKIQGVICVRFILLSLWHFTNEITSPLWMKNEIM